MADNLNLTPDRGPNVWDKQTGQRERWKTEVGAAVMIAAGAAAAFVGGRRLLRAVRESHEEQFDGRLSAADETADLVSRESDESFPASDSPSWTSTAGAGKGSRPRAKG